MGLSSNTLWHQTKKEGLEGIIEKRCLYYSYSKEFVASNLNQHCAEFAFPMISVCDLPLSETGLYLGKYGGYTIGLDVEWGKRNNFTAVWYCDPNSMALRTIMDMMISKIGSFGDCVDDDKEYQKIVYLFSHIKLYEWSLTQKNYKNYRFYDERELRLVPAYQTLKDNEESPMLWNYDKYRAEHGTSLLTPKMKVTFDWDDVKYIIVKEEQDKAYFRTLVESSSKRRDLNISYFTNKEVMEDVIGQDHNEIEEMKLPDVPVIEVATKEDIDEIFQ